MPASLLDFLAGGLFQAGWGVLALYLLVATQLTIFSVTLYLHRSQAHRAVDFHPVVAHFFRFWTWLTTSMITREWAAIHRKHHAKCETEEDPHSPQVKGIKTVFWRGVELYREARNDRESIEKYGKGCPDDWIERHLYNPHANLGPIAMLLVNFVLALFGVDTGLRDIGSGAGWLSIGISVLAVGLAVFNLIVDFDFVEMDVEATIGDARNISKLIDHIHRNHLEEPGVKERFMSYMVRFGIINPDGTPGPGKCRVQEPLRARSYPHYGRHPDLSHHRCTSSRRVLPIQPSAGGCHGPH